MDTDISAATDVLSLSKIRAQIARDAVLKANGSIDGLSVLSATLADPNVDATEFKREVILALIPKYMTTGTATTDSAILLDAQNDARRLKAALDEIMKL